MVGGEYFMWCNVPFAVVISRQDELLRRSTAANAERTLPLSLIACGLAGCSWLWDVEFVEGGGETWSQ